MFELDLKKYLLMLQHIQTWSQKKLVKKIQTAMTYFLIKVFLPQLTYKQKIVIKNLALWFLTVVQEPSLGMYYVQNHFKESLERTLDFKVSYFLYMFIWLRMKSLKLRKSFRELVWIFKRQRKKLMKLHN